MEVKNKRNICLVGPSVHMGGMQRAIVNLANYWAEAGINVHLILLFKLEHFFEINPLIQISEPPEESNLYSKFKRLLFLLKYIKTKVSESNSQNVLVFGRYYSALSVFALRNIQKKVIIFDRASPLYRDNIFAHTLTKLIFKFYKPTASIAQTRLSAEFQKKLLGPTVKIQVIPNSVRNIQKFDVPKRKIVLAVGRFGDGNKGFDLLAEAWTKIKENSWELVFAGGGEEDALKTGIKQILDGKKDINPVHFLGKVKDIDLLLNEASVFVMPSRSEGFPNALLEAMAAKTACVSFDFTAGASDLIKDGQNGLLARPEDTQALASALMIMMNDDQLRERIAKNNDYEISFSQGVIGNKILEFVETLKV